MVGPIATEIVVPRIVIQDELIAVEDELVNLYKLRRSIQLRVVSEPVGVRATVLDLSDTFRESFTDWCLPFTAGGLLRAPEVWVRVFCRV